MGHPRHALSLLIEEAAPIALETTSRFLGEHPLPEQVIFVLFSSEFCRVYQLHLTRLREKNH